MDVGTVVRALEAAILADSDFSGVVVERDEFVNDDPDKAHKGWVGIYRRSSRYAPLTLAAGDARRYDVSPIKLLLVWQVVDNDSGAACADRMETHHKNFMDLLLANDSITGTVDHVLSVEVEYGYDPRSDAEKGVYMQTAFMTLELEVQNE